MLTKRRKTATWLVVLGVALGICLLAVLVWTGALGGNVASEDQDARPAQGHLQTDSASGETEAGLSAGADTRKMPKGSGTLASATIASPPAGEDIPEREPPLGIVRHDMSGVRIALEKSNRPDLVGQPSGPERIRAHHQTLQIPEEQLPNLSTKELADKITSSSLFIMMIVFPDADGGLQRYAQSYNGVRVLLQRPDAAKTLLETYKTLSQQVSEVERNPTLLFGFTILEVLLSSEQVSSQIHDVKQRQQLVSAIVKSLDARARYDALQPEPVYGQATLEYSALAVARYLTDLNDAAYQKWYDARRESGLFVDRAATYEEAQEIIGMGRKYLQE
jgi:hypothetical protein